MKRFSTVIFATVVTGVLLLAAACSGGSGGTEVSQGSFINGGLNTIFGNSTAQVSPSVSVPGEQPSTVNPFPSVPASSVPVPSVPASSVPSFSVPASTPSVSQPSVPWDDSDDWDESDWDDSNWDDDSIDWSGTVSTASQTSVTPRGTPNPAYAGTYRVKMSAEMEQEIAKLPAEQQSQVRQLMSTTMTLNTDGTLSASLPGLTSTGNWWDNGNGTVTLVVNGQEMTYSYSDGKLYDPSDMSGYFQKD